MPGKALVVDANILVHAVLGKRVRTVIETYCDAVSFFVPEAAYAEAEEHLSRLAIKRGGDPEKALAFLRALRSRFAARTCRPMVISIRGTAP